MLAVWERNKIPISFEYKLVLGANDIVKIYRNFNVTLGKPILRKHKELNAPVHQLSVQAS